MHTTHTQKIIPISRYFSRPARWRLETPTERQERIRLGQMILDGLRPRVLSMAEYVRMQDALGASYGHGGPEGAAMEVVEWLTREAVCARP